MHAVSPPPEMNLNPRARCAASWLASFFHVCHERLSSPPTQPNPTQPKGTSASAAGIRPRRLRLRCPSLILSRRRLAVAERTGNSKEGCDMPLAGPGSAPMRHGRNDLLNSSRFPCLLHTSNHISLRMPTSTSCQIRADPSLYLVTGNLRISSRRGRQLLRVWQL